jgi:hypothetical protein
MSDPARESADGFQLRGLPELFFKAFALRNVVNDLDEACYDAALPEYGKGTNPQIDLVTAFFHDLHVDFARPAALHGTDAGALRTDTLMVSELIVAF